MYCGLKNIMVSGSLGKVPETCFTTNDTSIANFSLDCDRSWKNVGGQRHTEIEGSNVVSRASLAEILKEYLEKGSLDDVKDSVQSRTRQN
jgi:single-strand DNA-binding protein